MFLFTASRTMTVTFPHQPVNVPHSEAGLCENGTPFSGCQPVVGEFQAHGSPKEKALEPGWV